MSDRRSGTSTLMARSSKCPEERRTTITIGVKVAAEFHQQFKGGPCPVFAMDLRAKAPEAVMYTYPDIVVVCGEPQWEERRLSQSLLNPILLIEVLSLSTTEAYDRGKQFTYYQTIQSLGENVLISQREYRVERFLRRDDRNWIYEIWTDPNAVIEFVSVNASISMKDIYDRVDFETARPRPTAS
jgi:Uma2 family endonuclease